MNLTNLLILVANLYLFSFSLSATSSVFNIFSKSLITRRSLLTQYRSKASYAQIIIFYAVLVIGAIQVLNFILRVTYRLSSIVLSLVLPAPKHSTNRPY